MLRNVFGPLILAGFAAATLAAHDPSLHKGKPTLGQVVSISSNRLELKTDKGVKTVTLTNTTKYERGKEKASSASFKPGDQVTVFGTTLATGEIVAKEVLLGSHVPAAQKKPKAKD